MKTWALSVMVAVLMVASASFAVRAEETTPHVPNAKDFASFLSNSTVQAKLAELEAQGFALNIMYLMAADNGGMDQHYSLTMSRETGGDDSKLENKCLQGEITLDKDPVEVTISEVACE